MRHVVLPAVLGLAVLAALVWLFGRGGGGASAPSGLQRDPVPAAASPAEPAPAARLEPVAPGAAAAPPEVERRAPAPERIASAPVEAARDAGGRRVRGRVVDGRAQPVEGAAVAARPAGAGIGLLLGEIDGEIDGEVAAEARTDGGGRFELALATDSGAVDVRVLAAGYAPLERRAHPTAGSAVDLGDLVLDRGVVLAGRVVDVGGRPVGEARVLRPVPSDDGLVIVGAGPPAEEVTVTDRDGRFEVASQRVGAWELLVRHPEHPDALVEGRIDEPGGRATDLLVVLEDGFEIRGTLAGVPAAERGTLTIRARPADGPGAAPAFTAGVHPEPARTEEARVAAVEPDGTFVLRGLRQGRAYRLAARAPDGGGRSPYADATAGDRGVELEWSLGAAIVFQAVDARDGRPLETLDVSSGARFLLPLTDADGRPLRRFEEGRVRVEGLWPRGERDLWTVRVGAPGYEPEERVGLRVEPEEELDLGVLALRPVPRVRVTVRDAATGAPIEGARVELREERPAPPPGTRDVRASMRVSAGERSGDEPPPALPGSDVPRGETDHEGVCVLTSLAGKRARVLARADGHAPARSEPLELPRADDVDCDLALVQGGSVVVTVVDREERLVPGAVVEHDRPLGAEESWDGAGSRRTDVAGRARFEHLEPGVHAFRIEDDNPSGGDVRFSFTIEGGPSRTGEGWEEVVVAGGEESELLLMAPARASLSGTVTEDGEPLANAKVALHLADDPRAMVPMPAMFGNETSARTDSAGRYLFDDLKVAEYRVVVTHASRVMPHELRADLDEGENELEVALSVAVIEGRVLDEAGEPRSGATVKVTRKEAESGQRIQMVMIRSTANDEGEVTTISGGLDVPSVTTDEEGRYSLRGVVPDVDLFVRAEAEGYEPATSDLVRVEPGELRRFVDVQLSRGGTLVVRVTRGGKPAESALVIATFQGESEVRVDPRGGMVESGELRLDGLLAGPWQVRVQDPLNPGDPEEGPEPREVEVRGGEEEVVEVELE